MSDQSRASLLAAVALACGALAAAAAPPLPVTDHRLPDAPAAAPRTPPGCSPPVEQLIMDAAPNGVPMPLDAVFDSAEAAAWTSASVQKEILGAGHVAPGRAFVLHGLLSSAECRRAVAWCRGRRDVMAPAHTQAAYRNSDRVVADAPEVAAELLRRVRPFLMDCAREEPGESPESEPSGAARGRTVAAPGGGGNAPGGLIEVADANRGDFLFDGVGREGTWQLHGLNRCLRLCRYDQGGHFGPHFDGEYEADAAHRSFKTFMVYLNDDFSGGATAFVADHDLHFDAARGIYCSPPGAALFRLQPRAGDCLVFDHRMLHEGGQVAAGEKFILRSDVVYARVRAAPDADPAYAEATELLVRAQLLEAQGGLDNALEAARLFRQAFKRCPALEKAM